MQNNWDWDIFEKLRPPHGSLKIPNWNWDFFEEKITPPPLGNFSQIFPIFFLWWLPLLCYGKIKRNRWEFFIHCCGQELPDNNNIFTTRNLHLILRNTRCKSRLANLIVCFLYLVFSPALISTNISNIRYSILQIVLR